MKCVVCGGATHVVYTKFEPDQNDVRRRRECLVCNKRFISVEAFHHLVKSHEEKKCESVKKKTTVKPQVQKKPVSSGKNKIPSNNRYKDKEDTDFYYDPDFEPLSQEEMKGLGLNGNWFEND